MISGFADAAANERTFLAWVRTGIAVIALGFVVERFNLFLLALAGGAVTPEAGLLLRAGPTGRFGGMGLVGVGVAIIALATLRFFATLRLLERETPAARGLARATLVVLSGLVLGVAGFSAYLGFG